MTPGADVEDHLEAIDGLRSENPSVSPSEVPADVGIEPGVRVEVAHSIRVH